MSTMFYCHRWKVVERFSLNLGWPLVWKTWKCREFDSCHWNVTDFTKSPRSVREKILWGKSCLKLFIVSCIFASIVDFAELVHFILVSLHASLTVTLVPSHKHLMGRSAANGQCNVGVSHCLESGHPVNQTVTHCIYLFSFKEDINTGYALCILYKWLAYICEAHFCLSNAMHGQNINLPVCVRHIFCQLAYRSDPSTDFYS